MVSLKSIAYVCTAFVVLLLVSCSPARLGPTDSLLSRLKNRGPVPLSSDNPYLAGNLLISREMEASTEVRGFIEHRGAPAAIEVQSAYFSPMLMQFYYPENREQYTLEDLEGTWVIRGPEMMERDKAKEVASLTRDTQGTPKLAFKTTIPPISDNKQLDTQFPSVPPRHPTSGGADEPDDGYLARMDGQRGFKSPQLSERRASVPKQKRESNFPLEGPAVSDQQEAQLVDDLLKVSGPHPAERTPRGDVVHYVTYSGETLSMIARWYTYDRNNAPKIARINRLADPDKLGIGDSIVIPAYMVKNGSRISEEAVRALKERNP